MDIVDISVSIAAGLFCIYLVWSEIKEKRNKG